MEMAELQALIEAQKKKSPWPGALGQAGAGLLTGQRMGTAQAIATFLQGLAGGMQSGKEGQQTKLQDLLKQKMDMEFRQMQMDEMKAKIAQAGVQSPKDQLDLAKTQKEYEKMGRDAETEKNNRLAEQNLGVFQDPSQFEGMAPEDQERAKSSVRSAMLSQDPKVWNEFSKENTRVDELRRKEDRDRQDRKVADQRHEETLKRIEKSGGGGGSRTTDVKNLNPMALKKFTDIGNKIDMLSQLNDNFRPEYAGKTVMGGLDTKIKDVFGGGEEQVNWWKTWKEIDAMRRNEIFGASLTGNEKKSWDAITVTERSDPKTVQTAVKQRLEISKANFNRIKELYKKAGYNVDDFNAEAMPITNVASKGSGASPMTATNPKTGAKIQSLDGGKTWQPM